MKKYDRKSSEYLAALDKIKYENEKNLLSTQIEIQEQTFQNISREIHDNIGQKLSLAKLHLNTFTETNNAKSNEKINHALQFISEAINDLSDISRGLSSDIILNNGLVKALEFEVMQLQKMEKYVINFSISGEYIFLENKKELVLFRIVQEAINNFLKHAESSLIDIKLEFQNSNLTLEIKDYGKGFHLSEHLNGQKFNSRAGIKNIIKRAGIIGGQIQIQSKINEGTLIKIKVPYGSEKN
ncbi:MAG TPA: ATP-binding protein [Chitinophagaceae bacterium]|nr:ATP-binding protein [Chitinophagaceae bacterium]